MVGQAEILPVVLAKATWPELVTDQGVVVFIDNNSARYGLISGFSPVPQSSELISASYVLDAELGTFPWYSRVPSVANLADGPSRLDFSEVAAYPGSFRDYPRVPKCGDPALQAALAAGLRG